MDADERLRAGRLAEQRLTPATTCKSAEEAALAVIGVQAQDLRAVALALRSRVPGLTRCAVPRRTAAAHMNGPRHRAPDRGIRSPWLHALFAGRNARVFGTRFERFGIVEEVNAMRSDVVELCAERPRDRPSLPRALIERGHPSLEQGPINTFVPWLSTQGLIVTDTAGLLHAADLPRRSTPTRHSPSSPATAQGTPRATHPTSRSGPRCPSHRRAARSKPPGRRATLTRGPPMTHRPACCSPPSTRSCSATATGELFVLAAHDHHILRGGGMLKPVVLNHGAATGTWSIKNGRPEPAWFGRPAPVAALAREAADIERFFAYYACDGYAVTGGLSFQQVEAAICPGNHPPVVHRPSLPPALSSAPVSTGHSFGRLRAAVGLAIQCAEPSRGDAYMMPAVPGQPPRREPADNHEEAALSAQTRLASDVLAPDAIAEEMARQRGRRTIRRAPLGGRRLGFAETDTPVAFTPVGAREFEALRRHADELATKDPAAYLEWFRSQTPR
jgi:hypothetical protein